MATYLLRRLLLGMLTLVAITFIVYGLARNMPGTPLTVQMGESDPSRKLNPEDQERMKRIYGLDRPWHEGYLRWLGNVVRGDLGRSFSRKQPVTTLIGERIGPTFLLSGTALLLTWLLGVPLGLYASARSVLADERATSLLLYVLYSFPTFVAALFLQIIFAVWLGWFPTKYDTTLSVTDWQSFVTQVRQMALPVLTLGLANAAAISRYMRSSMLENMGQDYVRTARAKGMSERTVVLKHVLRNSLIPVVTVIALGIPSIFGGAIITENLFGVNGIGAALILAIRANDLPTVQTLAFIFAVLIVLFNLIADVLYGLLDPRIRYD
jgi:peptide/nickel transport system permease protein